MEQFLIYIYILCGRYDDGSIYAFSLKLMNFRSSQRLYFGYETVRWIWRNSIHDDSKLFKWYILFYFIFLQL